MVSELIRLSWKDFDEPLQSNGTEMENFLNDLDKYPHAFVLGSIMDKQIQADRAWAIPYKVYKELGNFDIDFLVNIPLKKYKELFNKGKYHRFNDKCATEFYEAIHKIKDEYGGDASRIWSGKPTSKTIVNRFLEFNGVGPKIATMATNILIREYKIEISDFEAIDVSVDSQVEKVMPRLGLVSQNPTKEEIINKAREMNPEYPGIIDRVLWKVGREYCHNTSPDCENCPLKNECDYYLKPQKGESEDKIGKLSKLKDNIDRGLFSGEEIELYVIKYVDGKKLRIPVEAVKGEKFDKTRIPDGVIMVRHTNNGFNALWNQKYPYQKAQYLETAQTIEDLLSKLKKRDDIDDYHVFNWEDGKQLL